MKLQGFMLVVRDLVGEAIASTGQSPPAAAEIGVARGQTSALLLRSYPTLRLHMVDPWSYDPAYMATLGLRSNTQLSTQEAWDEVHRMAMAATDFAADRRTVWRTTSLEAARQVADASLSLVFIDAVHTASAVATDVAAWWPKVMPGGIMAGDDYCIGAVRKAAHVWAARTGLSLELRDKVWWVWKR